MTTGRYSLPAILLRIEGLAALATSILLYARNDGNWLLLAVLLLAPDLSALGYLVGKRVGATTYNIAHTYALPAILGGAGLLGGSDLTVSLALIWAAHIGMDRAVGYGLKYPSDFKDTHLSRV
ncbi:MAG: DUF4260 domain-containing protein [Chloroflexota bacterium]|nr:DUF4260 domain-containing protein [Chloroflexota bacterium]